MTEIKNLINQAWNLRWAQEIESTVEVYTQIQAASPSPSLAVKTEMALLWVSLLRAQGRQKESISKLKLIENEFLTGQPGMPNRFYFERGLARYVLSDFLGAFEDFALFCRKAESEIEQMAGLINKLLCLENMGFVTRKTEDECQSALARNESEKRLPWPQMRRTFLAFGLRKALRSGDLKTISGSQAFGAGELPPFDYVTYLQKWVQLFPFNQQPLTSDLDDSAKLMISGVEHLYHKSYRLRTLIFKWHPDDFLSTSLTDMSERLYLWIWTWMAHPERVSPEKLGYAVKAVAESTHLSMATPLEAALIRNSVAWLALFNNDLSQHLRTITVATQSILSAQALPLFDLEYSLIQLMQSARQYGSKMMDENVALLSTHPLWNDESLHFKTLYENLKNPQSHKALSPLSPLSVMADRLRKVVLGAESPHRDEITAGGTLIEVRLTDYSITHMRTGNVIVSEPLAKAIALFSRHPSVPASDCMRECFGIRAFDPFIHNTKLYNLIARVKSILSEVVNVKTRQSIIYTEGAWSRVEIKTIDPIIEMLRDQTQAGVRQISKSTLGNKTQKSPVSLLEHGKQYSRDELAEIFVGSKATVIRTINKLIVEKKLKRKGGSRAIKYLVLSNLSHLEN